MAYRSQRGNLAVAIQPKEKSRVRVREEKITIFRGVPRDEKILYLLLVILMMSMLGFYLSQSTYIAELNYELQQTEKEITRIQEQTEALKQQIAMSSSPERILKHAEKIGMIQADPKIIE